MADLDLDAIAAVHRLPEFGDIDAGEDYCHGCGEQWPCPTRILVAEVRDLRVEVAQLDAICRWNALRLDTYRDPESGFRVGGLGCEHPSLTGDRCDACGWTEAWEADRD